MPSMIEITIVEGSDGRPRGAVPASMTRRPREKKGAAES
jgi:hypothetical protein